MKTHHKPLLNEVIGAVDIHKIIYDLKDTCISVKEYLENNHPNLVKDEKAIYEKIVLQQEIGLCDGCNAWFELGELNEQSECEGCNSMEYEDEG